MDNKEIFSRLIAVTNRHLCTHTFEEHVREDMQGSSQSADTKRKRPYGE